MIILNIEKHHKIGAERQVGLPTATGGKRNSPWEQSGGRGYDGGTIRAGTTAQARMIILNIEKHHKIGAERQVGLPTATGGKRNSPRGQSGGRGYDGGTIRAGTAALTRMIILNIEKHHKIWTTKSEL